MTKFMRIRIEQSFTKTSPCADDLPVASLTGDDLEIVSREVMAGIRATAPDGTSDVTSRVVFAEIIEVP